MKKHLFILLIALSFYSHSQNYQPLNYFFNGTPTHGIKIKTNIPFQNGTSMPTVMLEGFEYGTGNVIDIKLNWYVYNNTFYRANASSSGSYIPEIKLANDNGKVSIYINDKKYYTRFSIRVYAFGKGETATMFDGWTAVDEPISGTSIKTVLVKNNFEGNMTIGGNVGVGTTTPSSLLDVRTTDGKGIWLNFNNESAVTFRPNNGNSVFHLSHGHDNKLYVSQGGTVGAGKLMTFVNTGNIGIGTTTPDSKLSVNGNIHTKEVKVDLIGWSDFVFEDNYDLPTLKEVEQYIKEKGHLQDIPSAKEVSENGILLGEMDSKLLQKIEELTLYTINQEKRIESLEEKNETLIELVKKLISQIEE